MLQKFQSGLEVYREEGPRALKSAVTCYVRNHVVTFRRFYDRQAENVFTKEWDLLIVLDGCQVALLEEVTEEYQFLPETIPTRVSVGAGTSEWLEKTFTDVHDKEIEQTAYITANPHSSRVLGPERNEVYPDRGDSSDRIADLETFRPLWEAKWDADLGTVPARAVTNSVINYARSEQSGRVIAHYMQPHFPSVPDPLIGKIGTDGVWEDDNVWTHVRRGDIPVERAKTSYVENLRYVLDDVAVLLNNADAETAIITADHGNSFGNWGCVGHGHPGLSCVRKVPWVRTSADDSAEYQPDTGEHKIDSRTAERENPSVEDKLQSLGYM
jgi:hypothetical protein